MTFRALNLWRAPLVLATAIVLLGACVALNHLRTRPRAIERVLEVVTITAEPLEVRWVDVAPRLEAPVKAPEKVENTAAPAARIPPVTPEYIRQYNDFIWQTYDSIY